MAKKDTKQLLFENMEKLNPEFKLQEDQPNSTQTTTGAQQTQQYADNKYKMIAPQLKLVNTVEKFAPAFQGWFQYLGYSPHQGNISIQRVRQDVEMVMKQLGYK
jgi:hypothetical protein